MKTLNVAIVGAGIGGLTAANALYRRGINVAVYEKAHELRELGAGFVLGANGMRVFRELGLGDRIVAITGRITSHIMKTWSGDELPEYRPPYPVEDAYPLHRAEFQKLLVSALPTGTLQLGRSCVGATDSPAGVQIDFADGSQAWADVLVGADGIHSVLQSAVGAETAPVSEGIMAYRGLIPAERVAGIYDMSALTMWLGPGQSFLTFPVSAGKLLNLVAFVPTNLNAEESWSAPGDVTELAALYSRADKQVQKIIAAMEGTFRWGIYDREPRSTWSTERITLLGDSAHATTPHLGQGANMAIEDAITLAVLLEDAHPDDVSGRLRLYERLRVDRTRGVHDGSREAGQIYRSKELTPVQQSERIVAINDRLNFATYDAGFAARTALNALSRG
ncbi:FAD-dependent monooxygenase [Mycobacteroides abscessus]|nr:FAD-dependent monooxygenase [Mycobacteroides abscessus]MDM2427112.1 FAD-dependent monooxygenase [Mycobacteroides abscessus]MDM2432221.1 FAD-dependent monooxygenase [Mycobacteroides abscessus]MDM2436738.1 FAD-dependent monooxygenase [Mycobacteroides abscessus]MDM2438652.1 FAD-dependent monooxygenase [Mycobacteroides abscessus]